MGFDPTQFERTSARRLTVCMRTRTAERQLQMHYTFKLGLANAHTHARTQPRTHVYTVARYCQVSHGAAAAADYGRLGSSV